MNLTSFVSSQINYTPKKNCNVKSKNIKVEYREYLNV